jgi:hypothetical protein
MRDHRIMRTATIYAVLVEILTIIASILGGIAGGTVASHVYVRRTVVNTAGHEGQSTSGRRNQAQQAVGGSLAAQSGKGPITQNQTTMSNQRAAEIVATVEPRQKAGLPTQFLILRNVGDQAAENIFAWPAADGGGFLSHPAWKDIPARISGRDTAELKCSTGVAHTVRFMIQYDDDGKRVGPFEMVAKVIS